jgi:hypothetical protein
LPLTTEPAQRDCAIKESVPQKQMKKETILQQLPLLKYGRDDKTAEKKGVAVDG